MPGPWCARAASGGWCWAWTTRVLTFLVLQSHKLQGYAKPYRALVCQGGERELVLGVDDQLLAASPRSIPRADVAELCVQALLVPEARNRRVVKGDLLK